MAKTIHQEDHFFRIGDKIVDVEGDYKKASLKDAKERNEMFTVIDVIDKDVFKMTMIKGKS